MNSFVMYVAFALLAVANCEAPGGGYNYNRPSFGGSAGGASAVASGGNYQQEAVGGNTQEGLTVDPQLLDKIRDILLQEENKSGGGSQGGYPSGPAAQPSSQYGAPQPSSQYGAPQPSSQYGAPQQQYGAPSQQSSGRIVGIVLENTIPSIQVAQYRSQSGGSQGGYPSGPSQGGYPSGPSFGGSAPSFNAPSSNYGAPAPSRPSSNYGAPF